MTYSDVTQFVSSSSNFSSKTLSLGPTWSWCRSPSSASCSSAPVLPELAAARHLLQHGARQVNEWVLENGHSYTRLVHEDYSNNDYELYGTNFNNVLFVAGWGIDSRNRSLFADRGNRTAINGRITSPGSGARYYMADPLWTSSSTCPSWLRSPDAVVLRRRRLRWGAREDHGHSALPAALRRRPGLGARLPRGLARAA